MTWIARAASKFALTLEVSSSSVCVTRNGYRVEFADLQRVYTSAARAQVGAHLLGARIGIDFLSTRFDFSDERPSVDSSKRLSEAPSAYGRRFPRLVHAATLDVVQSITQTEIFHTPTTHPRLCTIYVREHGKALHALGQDDRANFYSDGELESLARSALFHEPGAYKPRVQQVKTRHGKIRVYKNTDSMMASRSLLLPDFDLDASRESGFATIPDIDILLVAEPTDPDREALKWELMAMSARLWRDALIPFSNALYELSLSGMNLMQESWSRNGNFGTSALSVTKLA